MQVYIKSDFYKTFLVDIILNNNLLVKLKVGEKH
jgi:hypothetical protein